MCQYGLTKHEVFAVSNGCYFLCVSVYISNLCSESKEQAVSSLLALLPLLRPGNMDAKEEFLAILPKILTHSFENGCHIEESRQLLSYSLIHPAMNSSERAQFKLWLAQLEGYQYATANAAGSAGISQVEVPSSHNGLAPQTQYRNSLDDVACVWGGGGGGGSRDSGIGAETTPTATVPPPLNFQPAFSLHPQSQQQQLYQNGHRMPSFTTTITTASSSSSSSSPLSCGAGTTCVTTVSSSSRLGLDHHPPLHASHSGPPVFFSSSSSSSTAAALAQYQQQQQQLQQQQKGKQNFVY